MTRKIERLEKIGQLSKTGKLIVTSMMITPFIVLAMVAAILLVKTDQEHTKAQKDYAREFLSQSYKSEDEFLGWVVNNTKTEAKASYAIGPDMVANYIESNGVMIRYTKYRSSGTMISLTEISDKRYSTWIEFDEKQALAAKGEKNDALLQQIEEMRAEHAYLAN